MLFKKYPIHQCFINQIHFEHQSTNALSVKLLLASSRPIAIYILVLFPITSAVIAQNFGGLGPNVFLAMGLQDMNSSYVWSLWTYIRINVHAHTYMQVSITIEIGKVSYTEKISETLKAIRTYQFRH